MKRLKIDETCDSFRQIRNNGFYYVDKSYFLCDYFGAEQKKAIMLTRPRRFGKTNESVAGVVLTGCLYTVKNSTYTGVNNIKPYTVKSETFSNAVGFTEAEVEKILADG